MIRWLTLALLLTLILTACATPTLRAGSITWTWGEAAPMEARR